MVLTSLQMNTESDTETNSQCTTRSDNTLIVNYENEVS